MAEWTQQLGDELERAQPLLRLLPGLAASHPCMNVLGCGGAAPGGGNRAWAVGGGVPVPSIRVRRSGWRGRICLCSASTQGGFAAALPGRWARAQ